MADQSPVVPQYPRNLHYVASRLTGFHRNQFRLETISSQSVGQNRNVRVNLPENSILDMKSFQWVLQKVSGNSQTDATPNIVIGNPSYANDFVQRVSIYVNGIEAVTSCSEWNTAWRLKRLTCCSISKDTSMDQSLSNVAVTLQSGGVAPTAEMVLYNWLSFIGGETSTRYWDTSVVGLISISLTTAPNEACLVVGDASSFMGTIVTWDDTTPIQMAYVIDEHHFKIDSISLDDGNYSFLVRKLIQDRGFLTINYKNYYTFLQDIAKVSAATNRFSLSSQSIDAIRSTTRLSSYTAYPVGGEFGSNPVPNGFHTTYGTVGTTAGCPKYFTMAPFNGAGYSNVFNLNNVPHPQNPQNYIETLANVCLYSEQQSLRGHGNLLSTQEQFSAVSYCAMTKFNLGYDEDSDLSCSCVSGFDSRGVNTNAYWSLNGLTTDNNKSVFIAVETTASLRCGAGKQIAIMW